MSPGLRSPALEHCDHVARAALRGRDLARGHVLRHFGARGRSRVMAPGGGEIEPFVRLDQVEACARRTGRVGDPQIVRSISVAGACLGDPAVEQ